MGIICYPVCFFFRKRFGFEFIRVFTVYTNIMHRTDYALHTCIECQVEQNENSWKFETFNFLTSTEFDIASVTEDGAIG